MNAGGLTICRVEIDHVNLRKFTNFETFWPPQTFSTRTTWRRIPTPILSHLNFEVTKSPQKLYVLKTNATAASRYDSCLKEIEN